MKNNLFNDSEIRKYAKNKAFQLTINKHDFLKTHAKKVEQGEFESEKSNYLYFYDFLRKVLGYKREENILFEDKEDFGRGKVEFVLKSDDKKFMIIELKDQNTDLDKPQARANDKRTPVDQAFSYAQHSDPDNPIDWIMVSNFKEFRLYNYNKRSAKCISFTHEDLLKKDIFKQFMVSFSHKSHIEKDYPSKILESTLITEQKLEKNFYQLFHETRLMLIKELEEVNDLSRSDAVHYAQLILNRYMFIVFAEDTGLLTSQISTDTIITPIIKGNLRHRSIWQRLNELFLDINEGNEYKKIPAYNGGLFEEDLDFIKIRDVVEDQEIFKDIWQKWDFDKQEENIKNQLGPQVDIVNPIYKNLLIISSFDFSSELDVNILGHIFENSIGDLEELKEDSKGRRKKEGIFYTPDYITDYICRNTIIPYLSRSGGANTVNDLIAEYSWGSDIEDLDQKLADVKIVDPACGSGAFLNKATDILLQIHEAIFDFKKSIPKKTQMREGRGKRRKTEYISHFDMGTIVFDAIEKRREILLSNIYGVDLNKESVEITKLSLFLKVCKKDKKLPALDNNIKCGNSLIDDPEYTDKPFNWEKRFPEIFEDGGFDVVIGNPPYVRQEKIRNFKPYLKKNYVVYTGISDLFAYFFEKGLNILKKGGMFSFICSNKFTQTKNDGPLRKLILNYKFVKYIDYTGKDVFKDVTTNPSIFVIEKDSGENNRIIINDQFVLDQSRFDQGIWAFQDPKILDLKDKIYDKCIKLKHYDHLSIYRGILTGFDKAFVINENTKKILIEEDHINSEIIRPLVRGKDLKRYKIDYKNLYLIFTPIGISIENYPVIKKYLDQFQDRLKKRHDKGKQWWELRACSYYDEFKKEKLMWGNLSIGPNFAYSEDELYVTAPTNILTGNNLKFVLAILNSKIIFFIFKLIGVKVDSGYSEWKKNRIEELPIYPAPAEEQQSLTKKVDVMLQLNEKLQDELNGFKHWIQKEFKVEKLSKKLEKYYELSVDEFIVEMRKKKVDTKSRKNREYLEREFNESLAIINPLLQEIKETDDVIDRMVYDLYGLTEDEIQIIEESLKS